MRSLAVEALAIGALVLGIPPGCAYVDPDAETSLVVQGVEHLMEAHGKVRHRGMRRIRASYSVAGTPHSIEYVEEVSVDGTGQYSIVPIDIVQSVVPPLEFRLLQRGREGFSHRYRDFRIRDLKRVLSSYTVLGYGQPTSFLGRDAWRIGLVRQGKGNSYDLTVDIETGLLLACYERDTEGNEICSMVYETLDLDPDLLGVQWHVPNNAEQLVDLADPDSVEATLGFTPLVPTKAPAGYGFVEAARVVDPFGRAWMKATYTDGVETAFFLHAGPTKVLTGAQLAPESGAYMHIGPFIALYAKKGGEELLVFGKLSTDELMVLVDSTTSL